MDGFMKRIMAVKAECCKAPDVVAVQMSNETADLPFAVLQALLYGRTAEGVFSAVQQDKVFPCPKMGTAAAQLKTMRGTNTCKV